MATGGENNHDVIGSEDLNDVVCDPCQENGELHNAVGMCIDCQDHLCQGCFHVHKISRTSRKHELLDKEAMLQSQRSQVSMTKDMCIEKCAVHEDKVVEYNCINHNHLGCSVCMTLDHRTCDSVRYIPHVAKDLANNEEYKQAERHLMSVVERSKKVTENNKQKTESLKKDCSEAVKTVQDFRKQLNKALDKTEADLIQQCESIKSEETDKLASIIQKFNTTLTELNALIAMKDAYQNNTQNCNLYTLVMKTKDTLTLTEDGIAEAEKKQSHINSQIKFVVNKETLNTLKLPESLGILMTSGSSSDVRPEQTKLTEREMLPESFGKLLTSVRPEQTKPTEKEMLPESFGKLLTSVRPEQTKPTEKEMLPESFGKLLTSRTSRNVRPEQTKNTVWQMEQMTNVKKVETKRIVRAEYIQDIHVKRKVDKKNCDTSGIAVLPDNRLVLTDFCYNGNVKLVDVKQGCVITYLTLSSDPYDVAMVTNCQVAITIPSNNKVAMVNVTATAMSMGRTLAVDGTCQGVDYKDGKLAVSFTYPAKVQVLSLQGSVLYTITNDQQGQDLFNFPYCVAFGQDNSSLYVSNINNNNVVHVKFDGTVVGTYIDSELRSPRGLLTDSSGHVYVSGYHSKNIHQMTSDCRKVQVLLTEADGLCRPQCISYSETDCRLYVGMFQNVVKVYRVILDSK